MKRSLIFIFAFCAILSFLSPANADSVKLATLAKFKNTKYPKSSATLQFVLGDNGIVNEFRWTSDNPTVPAKHLMSELERVENGVHKGAVLEIYDSGLFGKFETILLRGKRLSSNNHEGQWAFSFLNDGMSGRYLTCPVTVKKSADGNWQLFNASGKLVSEAKIIVGGRGVESVQGLDCK